MAEPPLDRIHMIKTRLCLLATRDTALQKQAQSVQQEHDEVRREMAQLRAELDAAVSTPLPNGEDGTLWLCDDVLRVGMIP